MRGDQIFICQVDVDNKCPVSLSLSVPCQHVQLVATLAMQNFIFARSHEGKVTKLFCGERLNWAIATRGALAGQRCEIISSSAMLFWA